MTVESRRYPETLAIEPLLELPTATVRVPGSKSLTNRALILAALAQPGPTELTGVLRSEDTEIMVNALESLGFGVEAFWQQRRIRVQPEPGRVIPRPNADLFVGNSGTSMRFLTALVALGQGTYHLDGVARMRERPIADLLEALQQLNVDARSERDNGYPPVIIRSAGLQGGKARIRGNLSSQFLSGLMMVAPLARTAVEIEVVGDLVSVPYVQMTGQLMRQFGVTVLASEDLLNQTFRIPAPQQYRSRTLAIEPDASAASYFFAAAAITGGRIEILDLSRQSLQGDVRFVDLLQQMGCEVTVGQNSIQVQGRPLRGIDVDMNDISDTVMTLGVVACFAEGPTTIRNVSHIRHKETDRLLALATELRRIGAVVDELEDGLRIQPRPLQGAVIETYNDHRMAMSLALVGLKVPGIVIKNPGCVAKTYPDFFEDLQLLRA